MRTPVWVIEEFEALRTSLEAMPSSREKSLALTKLDECEMWSTVMYRLSGDN